MQYLFGDAVKARLVANLEGFDRSAITDPKLRRAAVVIVVAETTGEAEAPIVEDPRNRVEPPSPDEVESTRAPRLRIERREPAPAGEACILLTRRPSTLRRHAGQFALPGGRLDAGETAAQAALRELAEELRLDLPADALIGALDDYPTRSGFAITPFVAWGGPAHRIDPDPGEVARVHRIPFTDLDSEMIPHLDAGEPGQPPVLSAPLATLGHHVYAPTAAILYQFREVAMHGRPTRVAHFDQPRFAWR
jgi:8-oxo-dGTP pyrophosphatase MutT (NUDIX family)